MPPYKVRIRFTGTPSASFDAEYNVRMTVSKNRSVTTIDVPETPSQNIELIAISPALEEVTVEWDFIYNTLQGSLNAMDAFLSQVFRGDVLGAQNVVEVIDVPTNTVVWSRSGTLIDAQAIFSAPPEAPTKVHMVVKMMVGSVVTF